jgi:hypothetical protein
MNSEDAAADRGRKMAMPALLDEKKRMLEVLFVYALRAFTICYTRSAVRIFHRPRRRYIREIPICVGSRKAREGTECWEARRDCSVW